MPASDQINQTLSGMSPQAMLGITIAICASILYGIRAQIVRGLNMTIDAYARMLKRKMDRRFSELPADMTDVEKADRVIFETDAPQSVSETWRFEDIRRRSKP